MIPGKIIIKDKVYFEYYEYILKAYEASKQLIEVNNVEAVYEWFDEVENPNDDKIYGYSLDLYEPGEKNITTKMIKNNQKCKAEIKDNKATIISLTKE
jgi:hypothetical protein